MLPLSSGLQGALAELLRDSPTSDGKVTFSWKASVGPAIQRVTHVKLEHRVLLVEAVNTQWAREVRRASPMILKRLQSLLGVDAVERIEVCRTLIPNS